MSRQTQRGGGSRRLAFIVLAACLGAGCSDDAAGGASDPDPPDRGVAADQAAPDAVPSPDAAPDAAPADGDVPDQVACAHDTDCGPGAFCAAGFCQAAPPAPAFAWPADGVTRAAASAFDILPGYLEPWVDAAGPDCPDNRPGRFDSRVDAPAVVAPCTDHYDDANGNGRFDAVWLAGAGMDRPAQGIDNDNPPSGRVLLLARDATLRVLVVLDVHAVDAAQAHGFSQRLGWRLGLPAESVIVVATGDRSGPDAVGLAGPSLERLGPGIALRARAAGALGLLDSLPLQSGVAPGFWDVVADRAAAAIRQAAARLTPVRVRVGRAALPVDFDPPAGPIALPDVDADGVLNDEADRAHWRGRPQALARDDRLPGLVDPELRVLALDGAMGGPVALVASWGAAPATRAGPPRLSADYPGVVRAHLERARPGAVAVWLPAAAADTLLTGAPAFVPEVDAEGRLVDASGGPVDALEAAAPAGDPTAALGRYLGGLALAALDAAEPADAQLVASARYAWLPLTNPRFGLAARLGLLPRLGEWLTGRGATDAWASSLQAPACGGLGCLRYRLDRLDLGPVTLITTPGSLDLAFALGAPEATLPFGDERNLGDLDGDGLPDGDDPEIRVVIRGNGRELPVVVPGPANPQRFPATVGLATDGVWLVGRANGGVGSMVSRVTAQNVFEGQLGPLLAAVRTPGLADVDVCLSAWPCRGTIPLGELAEQAWSAQTPVLADLPGAHELWLLVDVPTVEGVDAWRIEDAAGEVRAAGERVELGPGRRAWLPDVDLVALEVERGDTLVLAIAGELPTRLPIGGVVPVELRQHPNAGDAWHADSPAAGDLVYNTACELLFADACPYRRPPGPEDPGAGLPQRP